MTTITATKARWPNRTAAAEQAHEDGGGCPVRLSLILFGSVFHGKLNGGGGFRRCQQAQRDGGSGCEGTEEGKTEWWFRWLQRTPAVKKLDGGRRARRPRRRKLNGGDRESSVFLLSLWRRR
ncbi:hypothetical protein PIB30_108398, partial [Stylosanthes scabra]|nr:hypothetical protein [Stylosanthes scabra]